MTAECEPPVEGEQRVGGKEGGRRGAVTTGAGALPGPVALVGRADHRPRGERPGQFPGPVHPYARRGERPCGRAEQFRDLLVRRFHGVRNGGRQQGRQRRPGPGCPAQCEQGVHPGLWAEQPGCGGAVVPDLRRVGDQRGVLGAVDLQYGAEGRVAAGDVLLRRCEARDLDAQRQPYAPVVARRDIGGPRPQRGQVLGGRNGVGRSAGDPGGAGRARQPVGDRVHELPQHRLRRGQHQGIRRGVQRHGVGRRRHGGRQDADPLQVGRRQRADAPCVVGGGAQAGEQQSARGELQGQERRGAPEGGRGGGVRKGPRPRQHRQRVGRGDHQCRDRPGAEAVVGDHEFAQAPGPRGRWAAVRVPEGDQARPRRIRGQEDRGAAGQFVDLVERCRRKPVHTDTRIPQV